MSSLAMLKIVEKQNAQLREQNRVLAGLASEVVLMANWCENDFKYKAPEQLTAEYFANLLNRLQVVIAPMKAALTATSQGASK